jgi:hypothetical protein
LPGVLARLFPRPHPMEPAMPAIVRRNADNDSRRTTREGYVVLGSCVVDVFAPCGAYLGTCANGDIPFLVREHKAGGDSRRTAILGAYLSIDASA